jgi:hypothetical protein
MTDLRAEAERIVRKHVAGLGPGPLERPSARLSEDIESALAAVESRGAQRALREAAERLEESGPVLTRRSLYDVGDWLRARAEAWSSAQQTDKVTVMTVRDYLATKSDALSKEISDLSNPMKGGNVEDALIAVQAWLSALTEVVCCIDVGTGIPGLARKLGESEWKSEPSAQQGQ